MDYMERITVRADEVKVGDRLADPDTGEAGPKVTDLDGWFEHPATGREVVEVFTSYPIPVGPPALTLAPSDPVEVWR